MLRIVYCGCDYFSNCFEELIARNDVRIMELYVCGGGKNKKYSKENIRMAKKLHIPVRFKPISKKDVTRLFNKGCDFILSAGYAYKIPIGDHKGLNIHPTLLPTGRGAWPFPKLILDDFEESGVSIHKLTEKFDSGDIVLQQSFPLDGQETLETLHCKNQIVGLELLKKWLDNPEESWNNAVPQGDSEYWKTFPAKERVIDFNDTPEHIDKMARAFGKDGLYLYIDRKFLLSDRIFCQRREHSLTPGTVIHRNCSPSYLTICVAINGGILIATDAKPLKKASVVKRIKRKIRKIFSSLKRKGVSNE